ncbi:S-adenosyl-l-methionine hydroxide adenosyltransferase family protein [Methanolobus zinderi]|uniref:S-adenosyl-l-methionine hydroxide adenosyltransferase family protein n=1 Tax=Methanolobus zinderi TaxID=536044 RepID=A0A7D5IAK3_9EURY|nr:S-adenosyl-l-methionine hydroxide adenosyltransferase family protein [Methanolobus zinderi]QLC51142.1 S-adenosyl-l-methionine hydroxide adenosyltransferase family protein [Methanolobus zinderi]
MPVITLTTDFGSLYPAALKAVILGIEPGAQIVDITHSIAHADIRAGAFAMYTVVDYFPKGTVHVAVVDPGVGTERNSIVISSGGQFFVGPDNGLMIPAALKLGDIQVYKITNTELLGDVSSTFHGRDIFARIGAHLLGDMMPDDVGEKTEGYVNMDFGAVDAIGNSVSGEVIYVDDFGNIITNISGKLILDRIGFGEKLNVSGTKIPFMQTYGFVNKGELLSLIGSHGFFEIAVNLGSAASELGIKNGDKINILIP